MTHRGLLTEDELAAQLRAYAETPLTGRAAGDVAQSVIDRRPARLPLWRGVALPAVLIGLAALALLQVSPPHSVTQPATVTVGDTTYGVLVARDLEVPEEALHPYAAINMNAISMPVAEAMTYSIRGVDPGVALVVPLVEGASDDAGALGDYALLHRGPSFSQLCPYFGGGSGSPDDCS